MSKRGVSLVYLLYGCQCLSVVCPWCSCPVSKRCVYFVCLQVKVMLRVSAAPGSQGETGTRFLSVDTQRKQITIFDPSASGYVTSANRRTGIAAPKMFAFDAVFSPDDSLVNDNRNSLSLSCLLYTSPSPRDDY